MRHLPIPISTAFLQDYPAHHMHQVLCNRVLPLVTQHLSSAVVVDDHEVSHLNTGDNGLRQDCLQNVHGL